MNTNKIHPRPDGFTQNFKDALQYKNGERDNVDHFQDFALLETVIGLGTERSRNKLKQTYTGIAVVPGVRVLLRPQE